MSRWDRGTDIGPTIPEWFFEAVETPYEERAVEVDECDVVYQFWQGGPGARGSLLFVHGMNAHAHWWDFIAPRFLEHYRCAAMNLTGMGDSDYRYDYRGDTYAEEIKAVCDHAGFGDEVVLVAHSFGANMAVKAAVRYPDRFRGLVLVDSGIRHPDEPEPERPPMGGRGKVYPDKETALGRFRLQPPQPCENTWLLEYIARHSLMPVDGGGWTWKFDEDLPETLHGVERDPDEYRALALPVALLYGADSALFTPRTLEYMRELIPGRGGAPVPAVAVDGARHHVFLDQPLAFAAALEQLLTAL